MVWLDCAPRVFNNIVSKLTKEFQEKTTAKLAVVFSFDKLLFAAFIQQQIA